jgi:CubicO group peptidase (beta-lactamase class C family)
VTGWRERGLNRQSITRENWNSFPQSIWSFQHAKAIYPYKPLSPATVAKTLSFVPKDLSLVQFQGEGEALIDLETFMAITHTDAMVIVYKGVVIYERYFRDMQPNTPHMLFSITKSLTGLAAEILIHQKLIDENLAVSHYVPELTGTAFGGVNIRHVLDMTDGVRFNETYADPEADIHSYSSAYWGPKAGKPFVNGVNEALLSLNKRADLPGQTFSYRTPVGDVVGLVISCAMAKPLDGLIQTLIWDKIGAQDEAYMLCDAGGQTIAATGLNATARDMIRLGLSLMDGHTFAPEVIFKISKGGNKMLFAKSDFATRLGWSYKSMWWVNHNPFHEAIAALGVYGQRLYLNHSEDLMILKLGSHPLASNSFTDTIHRRAFEALTHYLRS